MGEHLVSSQSFIFAGNHQDVAIDSSARWSGMIFAESYYHAACRLIGSLRREPPNRFETIPLLFVIRHYVELALKDSILESLRIAKFIDRDFDHSEDWELICKEHDLTKLADRLRSLAEGNEQQSHSPFPVLSPECLAAVRELNQCDPRSLNFRYMRSGKAKHLAFNLDTLETRLGQLREEFGQLAATLQVMGDEFQEYDEYLNEFLSD